MRHSHVFNFCLIFFKLGEFVLQLIPIWDCNPALSAYIFYPIWLPKITEKPLNTKFEKKKKNKTMIIIDLDPLMTNVTVFRSSGIKYAVKKRK